MNNRIMLRGAAAGIIATAAMSGVMALGKALGLSRPATMLIANLVFGSTLALMQRLARRAPAAPPRTTRSLGLRLAMRSAHYPSASF